MTTQIELQRLLSELFICPMKINLRNGYHCSSIAPRLATSSRPEDTILQYLTSTQLPPIVITSPLVRPKEVCLPKITGIDHLAFPRPVIAYRFPPRFGHSNRSQLIEIRHSRMADWSRARRHRLRFHIQIFFICVLATALVNDGAGERGEGSDGVARRGRGHGRSRFLTGCCERAPIFMIELERWNIFLCRH